jgi:hypothetical protein
MDDKVLEYQNAIFHKQAFNHLFEENDYDGAYNPLYYRTQLEEVTQQMSIELNNRNEDPKLYRALKSVNNLLCNIVDDTVNLFFVYNNYDDPKSADRVAMYTNNLTLHFQTIFDTSDMFVNYYCTKKDSYSLTIFINHLSEFSNFIKLSLRQRFLIEIINSPLHFLFDALTIKIKGFESSHLGQRNKMEEPPPTAISSTLNFDSFLPELPYDPNLFDRPAFSLFKFMIWRYTGAAPKIKYVNIFIYLKNDVDKTKYNFLPKGTVYKTYILEYLQERITKLQAAQFKYDDEERPALRNIVEEFEALTKIEVT